MAAVHLAHMLWAQKKKKSRDIERRMFFVIQQYVYYETLSIAKDVKWRAASELTEYPVIKEKIQGLKKANLLMQTKHWR